MIPYFNIQDPLEVRAFIDDLDKRDENKDDPISIFMHEADHGIDLLITRYRETPRALTIKTRDREYHFDTSGNLEDESE